MPGTVAFALYKELLRELTSTTDGHPCTISRNRSDLPQSRHSPIADSEFLLVNRRDTISIIVLVGGEKVALLYSRFSRPDIILDGSSLVQDYQYSATQDYIGVKLSFCGDRATVMTSGSDFFVAARYGANIIAGSSGIIVAGEGSTITCGDYCIVSAEEHFCVSTRPGTVVDLKAPGDLTIYDLAGNIVQTRITDDTFGLVTSQGVITPGLAAMKQVIMELPLNMQSYIRYGRIGGNPYLERT